WVREVMDKLYTPAPDGYCGDEDNGQTSAWYVFSAMGFYPVCPGANEYVLGSPLFKSMILYLENGKRVILNAENNSKTNRYIASVIMNGQRYSKNYLTHDTLVNGVVIDYQMSSTPEKSRGTAENDFPYSFSKER
ncbi:hypothetical protein EZS27_037580, partial [termite gut metagenome]